MGTTPDLRIGDEKLGEFKCPNCSWAHAGISEADAVAEVAEFNESFATLSRESRAHFGGESASLDQYRQCFKCGTPAATFLPVAPGDALIGCTLQVVIAPTNARERDATSSTDKEKYE